MFFARSHGVVRPPSTVRGALCTSTAGATAVLVALAATWLVAAGVGALGDGPPGSGVFVGFNVAGAAGAAVPVAGAPAVAVPVTVGLAAAVCAAVGVLVLVGTGVFVLRTTGGGAGAVVLVVVLVGTIVLVLVVVLVGTTVLVVVVVLVGTTVLVVVVVLVGTIVLVLVVVLVGAGGLDGWPIRAAQALISVCAATWSTATPLKAASCRVACIVPAVPGGVVLPSPSPAIASRCARSAFSCAVALVNALSSDGLPPASAMVDVISVCCVNMPNGALHCLYDLASAS
jgi:hypothetical protein